MGVKERKEREKLEMRDIILKAATEMFLKDGYDNISLRAIATQIEYSVGTIYLYFKDKAEVVHALKQQGYEKMNKLFGKLKENDDKVLFLKELGKTYIEFGLKNPEYYELMFIMTKPMEYDNNDERYKLGQGRVAFSFLLSLVENLIAQKKIRFSDPNIAALAIWSFLHGLISLHLRSRLMMFKVHNTRDLFMQSLNDYIDAITV